MEVGLVICDEGHRLKNSGSLITKYLGMIQTSRRIILSGTPIQNDLEEFYTMCEFVNPGTLGDLPTFRQVFINPINRGREPSATSAEKLIGAARSSQLLETTRQFVLRRTAVILEKYLPPRLENVVFCALMDNQRSLYNTYVHSSHIYNILQTNEACSALEAIMNLRLLCNHPSLVLEKIESKDKKIAKICESIDRTNYQPQLSAKMTVLEKMLLYIQKNTSDRVVLVSLFQKTLDLLEMMCKAHSMSFLRLDGSVPNQKRQNLVDRFNDPTSKYFLFLLSSKAGGVGLNLIGANRIILFDGDWNPGIECAINVVFSLTFFPAIDQQAMARVWRDGQKKTVHIYRLLCTGTIDEKIYQRQITKIGLSRQMVDEDINDVSSSFTLEELKDIFSYNASTKCDTHDLIRCDCLAGKEKKKEKNLIEMEGNLEEDVIQRKGSSSSVKEANSNMKSQVLNMRHFSSSFPDDAILACGDSVSFLFQLEIDWRKNGSDTNALTFCKEEVDDGSESLSEEESEKGRVGKSMFEISDSDLCFDPPFDDEGVHGV